MSTRVEARPAAGLRPEWTLTVVASTDEEPGRGSPFAESDDAHLVDACLAGRLDAYDVIVERHQRAIYVLCLRFVRSHEDAADLTQEVFLKAYRGLRRFRGDSALATWLYRIAVNACLNYVSARRPGETPIDDAARLPSREADPSSPVAKTELGVRVRAAVARLPRKQRAAIILRVYHDLSHKEIAAALGMSVGAAKANVFHALGNLRKLLAGEALDP